MSTRSARRVKRVRDLRISSARSGTNAKAVRMGAATIPGSLNRHKTFGRSQTTRRR